MQFDTESRSNNSSRVDLRPALRFVTHRARGSSDVTTVTLCTPS